MSESHGALCETTRGAEIALTCCCGWSTPWRSSRFDAQAKLLEHVDRATKHLT